MDNELTVEWTVELTIHVKGDDQENMLFLYPVRGFQLTGGGSSNSLGFPSLYGANGEENRIVLIFSKKLQVFPPGMLFC